MEILGTRVPQTSRNCYVSHVRPWCLVFFGKTVDNDMLIMLININVELICCIFTRFQLFSISCPSVRTSALKEASQSIQGVSDLTTPFHGLGLCSPCFCLSVQNCLTGSVTLPKNTRFTQSSTGSQDLRTLFLPQFLGRS